MSEPEKKPITPDNSTDNFPVPNGAPPPPNSFPFQLQWNQVPGHNGTNVFSITPSWNISQVGPQNVPSTTTPQWNVAQVGPQNFLSTTTQQWNVQPAMPMQNTPNNIIPQITGAASCHETFAKGKPKALGIVLIVSAICQILFAVGLACIGWSVTLISGISFWAPIFYIIAGSITISAHEKQSIRLVKSSYGLNIVSSIFSLTAIIINIVDFSAADCYYYNCYKTKDTVITIIAFILVLNMLVFCVTVSISVFGGRALEHVPSNVSPVFVIQNVVAADPPNSSDISISPPPYKAQDANC